MQMLISCLCATFGDLYYNANLTGNRILICWMVGMAFRALTLSALHATGRQYRYSCCYASLGTDPAKDCPTMAKIFKALCT